MYDSGSENGPSSKRARLSGPVIGTHGGTFHCDEVLACFMLRQLPEYENSYIMRNSDDNILRDECFIIVGAGGLFAPENLYYDHHQDSFEETLSNLRPEFGDEFKIRLSSAGLIYVYYGERVIETILKRQRNVVLRPEHLMLLYTELYRNFIIEIDAIDSGVPMYEGAIGYKKIYKMSTHLSARIDKMNPAWDEELAVGELPEHREWKRFEQAMLVVGREFVETVIHLGTSWLNSREIVRKALLDAESIHPTGEIMILPHFCPWKEHLADLEMRYCIEGTAKMVIYKENETSWRVAAVPVTPDSFLVRKALPVPWRGLRDQVLEQVSGVKGSVFVQKFGFEAGALTAEAALAMAMKGLVWVGKTIKFHKQ